MKKHWQPALFTLALLPATAAAEPTSTKKLEPLARNYFTVETAKPLDATADDEVNPLEFDVFWKDSINFRTKDKQFTAKIGGRIHHDWAWFSEDLERKTQGNAEPYDFENGTKFRRARLYLSGTIRESVEYKIQMDFAADTSGADFKDVYVGLKHSKEANVRVGQFKEPFSLSELTSSNYIAFMERGLPVMLAPSRNTGAMFHGSSANSRVSYAVGIFKDENDIGESTGSGEYGYTTRVTGLVVDTDDTLVHAGLGFSMRDIPGMTFDPSFRPASSLAPRLLNVDAAGVANSIQADESTLLGAELAVVSGPFWASGEYIMNDIRARDGMADATLSGQYVQAGYFLTGESRPYKRSNGTFTKVKPRNPKGGDDDGCGAWEVAFRYANLEFENVRNGGSLFTDELSDMVFGVNWYWNPNARIMFNYVMFDLDAKSINVNGDGSAFQTRFSLFL